jgi:hypothetical protein
MKKPETTQGPLAKPTGVAPVEGSKTGTINRAPSKAEENVSADLKRGHYKSEGQGAR